MDADEYPHQLKPRTDYGFLLYIPKTVWNSYLEKPARGDLIDASFFYAALRNQFAAGNSYTELNHGIVFHENPTDDADGVKDIVKPFTDDGSTAVDSANATVQMFNYNANISGWQSPELLERLLGLCR